MVNAATSTLDLVSVSGAARVLAVAENTVRLWTRRGVLPCARLQNGTRVFRSEDIERLRAERAGGHVAL